MFLQNLVDEGYSFGIFLDIVTDLESPLVFSILLIQKRLFIENLGRNKVRLSDGSCLEQGERGETEVPIRLELIDTVIRIEVENSRDGIYDTLPERGTALTSLSQIGDTPSPEELASWFETLLSVQRSAVGSEKFYEETASALVDLIGLDRTAALFESP